MLNISIFLKNRIKKISDNFLPEYVRILENFEDNSVDFVLVDGIYRDYCALYSLRVIRPGEILIVDNINWFIPNTSRSPCSRKSDFASEIWKEVYTKLKDWRCIWTTSGVTDTAFFFKPI